MIKPNRKRGEESKGFYFLPMTPSSYSLSLSLLQITNSPNKPLHHNSVGGGREMATLLSRYLGKPNQLTIQKDAHQNQCKKNPHWNNTAGDILLEDDIRRHGARISNYLS